MKTLLPPPPRLPVQPLATSSRPQPPRLIFCRKCLRVIFAGSPLGECEYESPPSKPPLPSCADCVATATTAPLARWKSLCRSAAGSNQGHQQRREEWRNQPDINDHYSDQHDQLHASTTYRRRWTATTSVATCATATHHRCWHSLGDARICAKSK